MEGNQVSNLMLRRSPRIIEQALRQELMHTQNESQPSSSTTVDKQSNLRLRRSPRIIEQPLRQELMHAQNQSQPSSSKTVDKQPQRLQRRAMAEQRRRMNYTDEQVQKIYERRRHCQQEMDSEEREQQLKRRRILYRARRLSMTEEEREAKRERRHNADRMRRIRARDENVDRYEAQANSTSGLISPSTSQNHREDDCKVLDDCMVLDEDPHEHTEQSDENSDDEVLVDESTQSRNGRIADAEEKPASPIMEWLKSDKEALANNEEPKIAEIEAFLQSFEDEKKDLANKVATLSEELSLERDRRLRITADFDNFRRTERDRLSLATNVQGEVVESLLLILDSFERAKSQIKVETEGEEKINNSYQSIFKQFLEIIGSRGIVPVELVGNPFDPMARYRVDSKSSRVLKELSRVLKRVCPGFLKTWIPF